MTQAFKFMGAIYKYLKLRPDKTKTLLTTTKNRHLRFGEKFPASALIWRLSWLLYALPSLYFDILRRGIW
jgi:hypothetical protein